MENNELSKEDYETIEAIVKAQLEHYNLIQPTAKDEVKQDVKERFNIEVYSPNITGNEGFRIHISTKFKMSKLMADDIAYKIKALLQSL
jgi:RNA:NAD 2'-phosphotransferase (TPT1/KptA family)